jgi:hypothetical protein
MLAGRMIADGAAQIVIDLASGDRTLLSGGGAGAGPDLAAPFGVAAEALGDRAILVDAATKALVAVDLATGDRRTLSDDAVAPGPGSISRLPWPWTRVRIAPSWATRGSMPSWPSTWPPGTARSCPTAASAPARCCAARTS